MGYKEDDSDNLEEPKNGINRIRHYDFLKFVKQLFEFQYSKESKEP